MSTLSKVDPNTLGWVKAEIDETLKQARHALESYTENTADEGKLRFCTTYLHQVLGTLQMVELDGAAMLARETEALAESVLNGKTAPTAPVIDTLIRGILTLPDYLARLQFGQPDAPLRFLALLNELRELRGVEPLNKLDLFQPDLGVRPAHSNAAAKPSEAAYAATTRSLRPAFQAILLNWLRDTRNRQHLVELAGVVERLQQDAPQAVVEQMFWVARGYLDTLVADSAEPGNDRKRLLARLEQQLKKIVDANDRSLLRNSAEALSRAMLYEIGLTRVNSGTAVEIRRAFALDELLPGGIQDYEIPTPEALQSVGEALGKEIEQAQDLLSTYFEQTDAHALEALLAVLRKMSGTLQMLNVEMLHVLVDELIGLCEALASTEMEKSEALSMPMAGALLLIENSTRDIQTLGAGWKRQVEEAIAGLRRLRTGDSEDPTAGIEITDASLTDSEFKQLVAAVGGEIRTNLGKIEEALETFAANRDQPDLLEAVPVYLSQIQGALQILGQERAAELVVSAHRYVQNMRDGRLVADAQILDALAVAVGTIGAYIEGLERDRPHLEGLLITANNDLAAALTGKRPHSGSPDALLNGIEKNLGVWFADHENRAALFAMQQDLRDIVWLADLQQQERIGSLCAHMVSLLEIVEGGDVSDEVMTTLRQSYEALAGTARQQLRPQELAHTAPRASSKDKADAVVASAPAAPTRSTAIDVESDDDIIQIFIEDAREMIALIEKSLPTWQADAANRDKLLDLRRAFHTLKGSGRMVGASDIAEFAWSVENMLNKVREGKITPGALMFELLDKTRAVLPEMVVQLEGGPPPATDVAGLRAVAEALAEDRPAPALPSAVARPVVRAAEPVAIKALTPSEELPQLDATLLQIFSNETRGHLDSVRSEVEKCRAHGMNCPASEKLVRAAHTLQGNARAVGLKSMAEASAETEKMLHAFQTHQQSLTEVEFALFERLVSAVEQLMDFLSRAETRAPGLLQEFAGIAQDAHAVQIRLSGPTGVTPTPAPTPPRPAARVEPPVQRPTPTPVPVATPEPATEAADTSTITEALDPELLEIFLEEAADIMGAIEESLTQWRGNRSDKTAVADLKRQLHTLKGGARMAGAMTMGDLGHHTESLLGEIESGRIDADSALMDLMDEVHDALVTMIDQMLQQKPVSTFAATSTKVLGHLGLAPAVVREVPVPPAPVVTEKEPVSLPELKPAPVSSAPALPAVEAGITPNTSNANVKANAATGPNAATATLWDEPVIAEPADRRAEADEASDSGRRGSDDASDAGRRGQIKVRTSLLNDLVNFAGEVSISRSRMEQQIFGLRENLAELNRNVTRFRDQIRDLEIQSESQILARVQEAATEMGEDFDPLELDRFTRLQTLSRSLAESLHDLFTIRSNLENYASQAETVLQQQARINTELQEGLMRTRMIGFASQGARLRHIVRQTARELGKRVDLELVGAEVEVDRTVLDRMIGPFEHMIRNALDHGLESEADRKRAGKPEIGRIRIQASHEGSEIVIRFADDGAGLDIAAIRRKAIERGLMTTSTNLSDDELIQFILVAGFSTASTVTQLSGRGVGMDVVHNEVKQLGGSITVDTRRGVGTTFIIRLPLTLSISQALMLRVSEQLFAVPLSSVVNILEVPVEELNSIRLGRKPLLNYKDQVYPFMHLAVRLGIPPQPPAGRKVPVLLARSGGRQVAIQVDGLAGTREIVIKPLGAQLAGIEGLAGATILGDGSVVLILDIPGLWITEEGMRVMHTAQVEAGVEPAQAEQLPPPEPVVVARTRALVMVVDDSITVRKVTQRHLQKRGVDVLLAKDGVEALEVLRDQVPDVMLVDIEMPRMDGYELTSRIRSDARLKAIPIIMITSRAGDKHRDKAFSLGVNEYMTKPYQEDELFAKISSLLPVHLASS